MPTYVFSAGRQTADLEDTSIDIYDAETNNPYFLADFDQFRASGATGGSLAYPLFIDNVKRPFIFNGGRFFGNIDESLDWEQFYKGAATPTGPRGVYPDFNSALIFPRNGMNGTFNRCEFGIRDDPNSGYVDGVRAVQAGNLVLNDFRVWISRDDFLEADTGGGNVTFNDCFMEKIFVWLSATGSISSKVISANNCLIGLGKHNYRGSKQFGAPIKVDGSSSCPSFRFSNLCLAIGPDDYTSKERMKNALVRTQATNGCRLLVLGGRHVDRELIQMYQNVGFSVLEDGSGTAATEEWNNRKTAFLNESTPIPQIPVTPTFGSSVNFEVNVTDTPVTGYAFDAYTGTETDLGNGLVQLTVTAPAHIAAHDEGAGAGVYIYDTADKATGPVVLYPGAVAGTVVEGGTITIQHEPFFAVSNVASRTYVYKVNGTQVAEGNSYTVTQAVGQRVDVYIRAADINGTTEHLIQSVTVSSATAPVLSPAVFDGNTSRISLTSSLPGILHWARYPTNYAFGSNKAEEVRAGLGAIEQGFIPVVAGLNEVPHTFNTAQDGLQDIWFVAEDQSGSGPLSNVVGGLVNIVSITKPTHIGSEISGVNTASSSYMALLPAYKAGDLVVVGFGLDCGSDEVAGLTVTGPNGEVAQTARAKVDNVVSANDSQTLALLYYYATADYAGGSGLNCAITAGGARSTEQMVIMTDVYRHTKSSSPIVTTRRTYSPIGVWEATSGTFTTTSEQSQVSMMIHTAFSQMNAGAPTGWTQQRRNDIGATTGAIYTRNAVTTDGETVAAAAFSISAQVEYVALTYEILPLGAL